MEDENAIKAPVTRRRRRLSVEQSDDAKVSTTPNTPNKKRSGRLAAKPELDLIDEDVSKSNTPKRSTKRNNVKDIEAADDKPLTPSRRSARIKSNSSIISETSQAIDSPRAKRALRRTSQVGSDNEAPLTPARQTRRTRKDSASNAEKETQSAMKSVTPKVEIISEEPESSLQKSQSDKEKIIDHTPNQIRQSPRLNKKSNSTDSENVVQSVNIKADNNDTNSSQELNTSNKENEAIQDVPCQSPKPEVKENFSNSNLHNVKENILSESSSDLLEKLQAEPNKRLHILNKSTSAVIDTSSFNNKRQRTKSWTSLSGRFSNDNHKSYSDSENTKKKRKISLHSSNKDELRCVFNSKSLNISIDKKMPSIYNVKEADTVIKSPSHPPNEASSSETTAEHIKAVSIEEIDSSSDKLNVHKELDNEDQCVPVVVTDCVTQDIPTHTDTNSFNFRSDNQISCDEIINKNDSCEPMDIDESIPETTNNFSLKTFDTTDKGTDDKVEEIESNNSNGNKISKLMLITSQTPEKTGNENKSTIVLSELKDISNEGNVVQVNTGNNLTKSNHALDVTQDNEVQKENNSSSLNYLTSTPLQQKSLIKLSNKVNTSGITSNNTSQIDKTLNSSTKSKDKKSNISSESLEDSELDESLNADNKFIEDEAEEASDDYESGDSRDEEEKLYEKENEIIEKGETLNSEDDDEESNDSDYEKDSFIVSSDAEDNELLDGSGDDLSISSNELKMTAKSKKKYNERKMKEQKMASKEMFDSRHKLNLSSKSTDSESIKPKKKRNVLESSDSDDNIIQTKEKKRNRMKLDSSHETSLNKSLNTNSNTNNNVNLSISMQSESVMNEVEISVCEKHSKDEVDPLSVKIKTEPKTPQSGKKKDSVKFTDIGLLEEEGYNNKARISETKFEAPLDELYTHDSSDSGENIHIQNYDSVLTDLNKNTKTKDIKEGDISLNLQKKSKKNKTVPIVDQLNLTQTKSKIIKSNKSGDISINDANKQLQEKSSKSPIDTKDKDTDSESSDLIDLHLLFSEDSNSSENCQAKDKTEDCDNNEEDLCIPVKKTKGKMNILDTSGHNSTVNESLTIRKEKHKNLNKSTLENNENDEDSDVQFFIDTVGNHPKTSDKPLNESTTNKSKQAIKVQEAADEAVNKSVTKTPKSDKKKKKRISGCQTTELIDEQISRMVPEITNSTSTIEQDDAENNREQGNDKGIADKSINKSMAKTPKSEKKRRKMLSQSISTESTSDHANSETSIEITSSLEKPKANTLDNEENVTKTPKSDKKKKVYGSLVNEQTDIADEPLNQSVSKTPKSEKKKKKKLLESQSAEEMCEYANPEISVEITSSSEKQNDCTLVSEENVTKTPKSEKKKVYDSLSNEQTDVAGKTLNESTSKIPKSEKKKKKKLLESQSAEEIAIHENLETSVKITSLLEEQNDCTLINEENVTKTPKSDKKKKVYDSLANEQTDITDKPLNNSLSKTPKSEKKKKKKLLESQSAEEIPKDLTGDVHNTSFSGSQKQKSTTEGIIDDNVATVPETISSKKRKRKSSCNMNDMDLVKDVEIGDTLQTSVAIGGKKKKRKISQTIENSEQLMQGITNKSNEIKKRKEREDDDEIKTAKVPKVNSDEKAFVPRLPESILNQLDDKPKQERNKTTVTKTKVISTSNFVVEETKKRKNKPSNYLEESIYLNEEETSESNAQRHFKNPKVLPFIPTASTSSSGYTTSFKISVIPKEIKFVAKFSDVSNYKNDYLQNKKSKKLGTYELYKRNRNIKMSKF